jgi:hypothetical protein
MPSQHTSVGGEFGFLALFLHNCPPLAGSQAGGTAAHMAAQELTVSRPLNARAPFPARLAEVANGLLQEEKFRVGGTIGACGEAPHRGIPLKGLRRGCKTQRRSST